MASQCVAQQPAAPTFRAFHKRKAIDPLERESPLRLKTQEGHFIRTRRQQRLQDEQVVNPNGNEPADHHGQIGKGLFRLPQHPKDLYALKDHISTHNSLRTAIKNHYDRNVATAAAHTGSKDTGSLAHINADLALIFPGPRNKQQLRTEPLAPAQGCKQIMAGTLAPAMPAAQLRVRRYVTQRAALVGRIAELKAKLDEVEWPQATTTTTNNNISSSSDSTTATTTPATNTSRAALDASVARSVDKVRRLARERIGAQASLAALDRDADAAQAKARLEGRHLPERAEERARMAEEAEGVRAVGLLRALRLGHDTAATLPVSSSSSLPQRHQQQQQGLEDVKARLGALASHLLRDDSTDEEEEQPTKSQSQSPSGSSPSKKGCPRSSSGRRKSRSRTPAATRRPAKRPHDRATPPS